MNSTTHAHPRPRIRSSRLTRTSTPLREIDDDDAPVSLSEASRTDFLQRATVVDLASRETVFVQGEPSEKIFLIVSGKVKIARKGRLGKDNILAVAGPGEFIGEMGLFDDAPQLATATVLTNARVAWLYNDSVHEWLGQHVEASQQFMRYLILRIRRQIHILDDLYGYDVGSRVARALLRDAHLFGRPTIEGIRVDIALSQEEMALRVRASRESVNQVIANLTQRGWIRREGTEIIVLNEKDLSRYAGLTE